MNDFKCFHQSHNAWKLINHYRSNPDNDYTIVVIYQLCDDYWSVFEVGMDFKTELGRFESIEYACMFADCFTSSDYMWYFGKDDKNIPWEDEERTQND